MKRTLYILSYPAFALACCGVVYLLSLGFSALNPKPEPKPFWLHEWEKARALEPPHANVGSLGMIWNGPERAVKFGRLITEEELDALACEAWEAMTERFGVEKMQNHLFDFPIISDRDAAY